MNKKDIIEALKVEKNATDMWTAWRAIKACIERINPGLLTSIDYIAPSTSMERAKLTDADYTDVIGIISSGNEPKLYIDVKNREEKTYFTGRILSNSPTDYARLAEIGGAIIDMFNLYIMVNLY